MWVWWYYLIVFSGSCVTEIDVTLIYMYVFKLKQTDQWTVYRYLTT